MTTTFCISFAIVCSILSYGLHQRRLWMWYVVWVLFYLFAAFFGNWFFNALYSAGNFVQFASALIYLVGGLVWWLPFAAWWSQRRSYFNGGVKAKTPPPAAH